MQEHSLRVVELPCNLLLFLLAGCFTFGHKYQAKGIATKACLGEDVERDILKAGSAHVWLVMVYCHRAEVREDLGESAVEVLLRLMS